MEIFRPKQETGPETRRNLLRLTFGQGQLDMMLIAQHALDRAELHSIVIDHQHTDRARAGCSTKICRRDERHATWAYTPNRA